jgi:ligand-binding sensor domain-containing protein
LLNKRRVLFTSICALLVGIVVLAAFVWRETQRTLEESAKQVARASAISFALAPLTPAASAAGLQNFGIRGDFQAFALFEGDWMICNRSSLFRYDSQGQLRETWRVGKDLPAYPLTGLTVRRGIPQPELWIATDGAGTLIWDGRAFRQLAAQPAPLRKQTALLSLSDGRMLVATLNAGLYVTDARQFTLFRTELRNAEVTALALGASSEEVWIGTRAQGVWLWRAGTLTHFLNELPDAQVLSIFGADGGVWVGTVNGVAEFIDGRFRRRLAEGVLAMALAESAGTLWISTVDEGTLRVDLKAHTPRPSAGMTPNARDVFHSVALLPTAEGVVALGDDNIRNLPEGSDVLAPPMIGLTNGHITALNVDRQRRVWIGYFNRGLDLLPNEPGSAVRHLENDVLFCVNRIKADPLADRMLVATANGLALFDMSGNPRQVLRARDGLISNHVTDVLFVQTGQGEGSTVVATNSGLTFMNGSTVASVYAFQGLVNNHVYTLAQTGDVLMAGTLGGVSLLRNTLVQNSLTTANSNLSQNWITGSVVAGEDIYLGTYGSGVMRLNSRFDVQSFREFANVRIEINPNAMLVTKRGVYAGTAGQGLAFLPAGQQRWHFWKAGLPSANVTALAVDDGDLYIGTDNGLIRIPERNITL